ncbi:GH36 C-terminal domain-containing protein [Streptomyces sp. NPDC001231]|uniref:GH36 C-terminal domain-containing protein n=1 Tax=Streptomyces sp. NPDC001231 TaxID=3364549 RepID=UPI0036BE8609
MAQYKKVRHIVQQGTQHRLRGPVDDGPTAVQYTTPDRREVFVLVWQRAPRHGTPRPVLRLAGLDPAARYRDAATGAVHHASVLTGYGITSELPVGDWSSTSLHLIRVDDVAADGTGPWTS